MHVYIYANVDVCSYEYTLSPPFSIIRVITTVVITTIINITIIIHIIIITPSSLSAYVVGIHIYIWSVYIHMWLRTHTDTYTRTHTHIYIHRHNLSIYFPHIHAGFVPASEELSSLVFQGRPNTLGPSPVDSISYSC